MSVALIIDGNSYVVGFWAGSLGKGGSNATADQAGTFLTSLADNYRHLYAAAVYVVFDGGGQTWRHELFPEYKAKRDTKPPELYDALQAAREAIASSNHAQAVALAGYEADDVVATIASDQIALGRKVVILSRDKDYHQLLTPGTCSIIKTAKRLQGTWRYEYYTAAKLTEEFGLLPQQWADFRTLTGDPSDNWPGCPGIGPEAAKKILKHSGTLADAMKLQAERPLALPINTKQRETLAAFDWQLGLKLMTLDRNVPLPADAIEIPF